MAESAQALLESAPAELAALSLDQLRIRPTMLRKKQLAIQNQLLALSSGPGINAFVASARCANHLSKSLKDMNKATHNLNATLPDINDHVNKLLKEADGNTRQRNDNQQLIAALPAVLELLELPQLMATCVRNNCADEALKLAAAVRARSRTYAEVGVLRDIASDVASQLEFLRESLLNRFSGALTLPEALRTVGLLRRLPHNVSLSDSDLRIAYLRGRSAHFRACEAALPRADKAPADYIVQYVSLCRTAWYEALSQYRAMFSATETVAMDDNGALDKLLSSVAQPLGQKKVTIPVHISAARQGVDQVFAVQCQDSEGNARVAFVDTMSSSHRHPGSGSFDAVLPSSSGLPVDVANKIPPGCLYAGEELSDALLQSWSTSQVGALLNILGSSLFRIRDGTYLASVIEQTSFAMASLGRVGMDLSPILRPLFRRAILKSFEDSVIAATRYFCDEVSVKNWEPPLSVASVAALAALEAGEDTSVDENHNRSGTPPPPPMSLVAFPILAVFVNHLLASMNDLRACAPYELRRDFFNIITNAIQACANALAQVFESAKPDARTRIVTLMEQLVHSAVPHLAACLDLMIPARSAPDTLGTAAPLDEPTCDGLVEQIVEKAKTMLAL